MKGGVAKDLLISTDCVKTLVLSHIANACTCCTLDINKHITGTLMREVHVQKCRLEQKLLAYEPDEDHGL